jgi:hypothetical protein
MEPAWTPGALAAQNGMRLTGLPAGTLQSGRDRRPRFTSLLGRSGVLGRFGSEHLNSFLNRRELFLETWIELKQHCQGSPHEQSDFFA